MRSGAAWVVGLMLLWVAPVSGQEVMQVHHRGGGVTEIPVADIDRIVFSGVAAPPSMHTVTDIDGNVYRTVTIGDQVWMAENLRVTRLRDGTRIPAVASGPAWAGLETPGLSWYDNNEAAHRETYGALYNFATVATNMICPAGWHVPTNGEWTALFDHFGGRSAAGGKLKEAGTALWHPPNQGATNESGFTGRPSGYRVAAGDEVRFTELGTRTGWWSSQRYVYYLSSSSAAASATIHAGVTLRNGYPLRCVMD